MRVERIKVFGFEPAFRGMRDPKESWSKSDSKFYNEGSTWCDPDIFAPERPHIGYEDRQLAGALIRAGTDHRKFLRQIMVWWDITLPRSIWQELDTYKVATVRNSCSTMYKLGCRDLTSDDFQNGDVSSVVLLEQNKMGLAYRDRVPFVDDDTGKTYEGVELLAHMKHRLPEGFLQMATYSFNYETGLSMYRSRRNHRMPEWSGPGGVCEWLLRLPYMKEFVVAMENKANA